MWAARFGRLRYWAKKKYEEIAHRMFNFDAKALVRT